MLSSPLLLLPVRAAPTSGSNEEQPRKLFFAARQHGGSHGTPRTPPGRLCGAGTPTAEREERHGPQRPGGDRGDPDGPGGATRRAPAGPHLGTGRAPGPTGGRCAATRRSRAPAHRRAQSSPRRPPPRGEGETALWAGGPHAAKAAGFLLPPAP